MSACLEDPAVATELEKVNLIPIPKKGSTKEYADHWATILISRATEVMLKILHAKLQHYASQELQMFKLGLEKEEDLEINLPTFTEL